MRLAAHVYLCGLTCRTAALLSIGVDAEKRQYEIYSRDMACWHAGPASAPMMSASSSSLALHPASSAALYPSSSGALYPASSSALYSASSGALHPSLQPMQHLNGHADHGMGSNASTASTRCG